MPHVESFYLLPPVRDVRGVPLAPVTAAACPGRGSSSTDEEVLP